MRWIDDKIREVTNTATSTAKYNIEREIDRYKPRIIKYATKYVILGGIFFSILTALMVCFINYIANVDNSSKNMTFMYNNTDVALSEIIIDIDKKEVNVTISSDGLYESKSFTEYLQDLVNKIRKIEVEEDTVSTFSNEMKITSEIVEFLETSGLFPESYKVLVTVE